MVLSAANTALAAFFYNFKDAVPQCLTVEEMCHQQPKTLILTDDVTVHGLLINTMILKASKLMGYNWLKYHRAQ